MRARLSDGAVEITRKQGKWKGGGLWGERGAGGSH